MAGTYTIPSVDSLETSLTSWQTTWNAENEGSEANFADEGLNAEQMASFTKSLFSAEGVTAGPELASAFSDSGAELPAVGTAGVHAALTAWNPPAADANVPEGKPAAAPGPPKKTAAEKAAAAAAFAAKEAKEAAEHAAKLAAETTRFTALNDTYRDQDRFKAKVKRTGWTKPIAGYTPVAVPCCEACGTNKYLIKGGCACKDSCQVCCGNDLFDISVILGCFAIIYAVVALFFYVMLEFALRTDDSHTALWIFFALLIVWWWSLLGTAWVGPAHNADVKARLDAEALRKLEAAETV